MTTHRRILRTTGLLLAVLGFWSVNAAVLAFFAIDHQFGFGSLSGKPVPLSSILIALVVVWIPIICTARAVDDIAHLLPRKPAQSIKH